MPESQTPPLTLRLRRRLLRTSAGVLAAPSSESDFTQKSSSYPIRALYTTSAHLIQLLSAGVLQSAPGKIKVPFGLTAQAKPVSTYLACALSKAPSDPRRNPSGVYGIGQVLSKVPNCVQDAACDLKRLLQAPERLLTTGGGHNHLRYAGPGGVTMRGPKHVASKAIRILPQCKFVPPKSFTLSGGFGGSCLRSSRVQISRKMEDEKQNKSLMTCEAPNCDRESKAKGLCDLHYRRIRKFNSFELPTRLERFEEYYMPVTETGCWIWIGSANRKGYGSCRGLQNRTDGAHRVSWQLYRGPIPSGMMVLHHCDVPACVNPDHLYVGTAQQNTDDMMRRGRHKTKRGSDCWRSKFSEEDVHYIRSLNKPLPAKDLAERYGVDPKSIYEVYNRKVWKHV